MFIIDDAKEKLKELHSKKDQLSDSEFQDRLSEISSQIEKANKEKTGHAEIQRSTAQGKILTETANEIKKSRVLKIILYWQHILNYIFYIVFILNIFITGLGLAGSENIKAQSLW